MTTTEEAKAAWDAARDRYNEAYANALRDPSNAKLAEEKRQAILTGRQAHKAYQSRCTQEIAAQIDALAPAEFRANGPLPGSDTAHFH